MLALFLRDLRLSFRAGGGALIGILFYLAVISVMPFGVGPDLNLLARIGPACCGSALCWQHFSASTGCFRRIAKMARLICC